MQPWIIQSVSISLQLSGALILLYYGVSTNRNDILKSLFDCTCYVIRDGNTNEINDISIPFREKYKNAYLNKAAFLYLSAGYLTSLFGSVEFEQQWHSLILVVLFSVLLITIALITINFYFLQKTKVTSVVTNDELSKLNIHPHIDSLSNEDIDLLLNN